MSGAATRRNCPPRGTGEKNRASPLPRPQVRVRPVKKWLKRLAKAVVVLVALGIGAFAGSYWYFSRDLPNVEDLRTWRPPQGTKVFCKGGVVCAEFYRERRTWVDVTKLPEHVKFSFLAAEDADFYQHK